MGTSYIYSRRWHISLLSVTVLATMLLSFGQPVPRQQPAYAQTSPVEGQSTAKAEGNPDAEPKSVWERALGPETWSNWFLLLAGIGGIVVAVYTLKRIASQARTMRHQTVLLRHQTKANIRAAKAAETASIEAKRNTQIIIDKERARLSVEFGTLVVGHPNDPPNESGADYTIRCNGTTQAEILEARIGIKLLGSGGSTAEDRTDEMHLPAVLMPGAIQGKVYLNGVNGTDVQSRFFKGELHAHLHGWIIYKDIFGSTWSYDFEYFRTHETQWLGGGKERAYENDEEDNWVSDDDMSREESGK